MVALWVVTSWKLKQYFPPKCWYLSTRQQGDTTQSINTDNFAAIYNLNMKLIYLLVAFSAIIYKPKHHLLHLQLGICEVYI
jgi:hypothetical protein